MGAAPLGGAAFDLCGFGGVFTITTIVLLIGALTVLALGIRTAGKTLDSSAGSEPLTFLEGVGQIIPGLEAELRSMKVGDKKHLTVVEVIAESDQERLQGRRCPARSPQDCSGRLCV